MGLVQFYWRADFLNNWKIKHADSQALHKRMFRRVWRWAGKFRLTERNHARLAADPFLVALGQSRFSWGRTSLVTPCEARHAYVAALRAADSRDIRLLLEFVRS